MVYSLELSRNFVSPHGLLVMKANAKLPIYIFPVLDPMAWKEDVPNTCGKTYVCLPYIHSSSTGSDEGNAVKEPLNDPGCSMVVTERRVLGTFGSSGRRTS